VSKVTNSWFGKMRGIDWTGLACDLSAVVSKVMNSWVCKMGIDWTGLADLLICCCEQGNEQLGLKNEGNRLGWSSGVI